MTQICWAVLFVVAFQRAVTFMPMVRPISLLTLSLVILLESNFPGKSLGNPYGPGIPPLQIKIVLESNPLKSPILVGRLAVRGPRSTVRMVLLRTSTIIGYHRI